jgi:hypothetical protein
MAQILFRLKDNNHPNPDKDRRGSYKKGYPVSIKPDGWYEGNPNWWQSAYADKTKWFVVEVTDATVEQLQHYAGSWKDNFDYEIVEARPAQGQYDVRVFEQNASASGANAITQAKVESFLTKWGCTAISATTNSVAFTFSLWNAVRSDAFWEIPSVVLKGSFVLNGYTPATGVGNITFTVLESAFPNMDQAKITTMITRKVEERGGTVIGVDYPAFAFTIERSDILQRFRADVKRKGEGIYRRRQFVLPTAVVDTIVAAGGFVQRTKAELLAEIRNGLSE